MKQNKYLKKIVAVICAIILLMNGAGIQVSAEKGTASAGEAEEGFRELTFSDYGISDGTTAVGNQTSGSADGLTSMDGVAFTGNVILQDSAGLFWWNAVRVGFGSGSNQGGIGISRTGNRIILYNYCTGGAPEYLGEVSATQHGVADLDTTAVTVRFTFKYIKDSTDVAMTISLNGTKYYEGTLTGGQNLLGNSVLVWAYDAAIAVESVETGEPEENFRELTFSDYGISDGTTAVGNQTSGSADGLTSMDGVAFTGNVILQDSAGLFWWNAVRVGFGSGSNQGGIGISRTGNRIILYNYCTGGAPEYLGEVSATQHGVADLDTTAVTVRFTFKYIKNSTDVAMTISLNETKYYEGTLTGGQNLLGNSVLVWAYDAAIAVQSTGEHEIEQPEVKPVLTPVTLKKIGIADAVYKYSTSGIVAQAQYAQSLINMEMTQKMIFSEAEGNRFTYAGGIGPWYGIRFITSAGNIKVDCTDASQSYTITPNDVASEKLLGEEIELKLELFADQENPDDVWLGVSVNGQLWKNSYMKFKGAAAKLGSYVSFYMADPEGWIQVGTPEPTPVLGEGFKKVTFASYGIESGVYGYTNGVNGHCKLDCMDKVVFSDIVKFSEEPYAQLRIGGKASPWEGIILSSIGNGRLQLSNTFADGFAPVTFEPSVAGTDLIGVDVELIMSFEYVDYDGDGQRNDVKLGVWFNGKPYADRWIYLQDKAEELGGFILIHCPNEETYLSITTYIPSVDFGEYGFTEKWAFELGLKKEE